MTEEPDRTLAVFLDFENLALGFEKSALKKQFDIQKILDRLVEKGKVLVKKAYADWGRFSAYKLQLHEAAFELVDIPKRSQIGRE